MSRRPADRAAQNQATLKTLVKLESNKSCADCKRNKHPRWASWNLGIFVCIRCSGIHRGMGTHISRVKSVDLDAWTDEQLQSVINWGNARANKYWEAKLAPGHVPSEAKIENFIRTKYESKRWVMDGPIPDPSTLSVEGEQELPPTTSRSNAQLVQPASQRTIGSSQPIPPPKPQAAAFDLMGGEPTAPPVRPSTTEPSSSRQAPPKQQQPSQLLGGLDFLGGPPDRPSSASSSNKGANVSRPDLKQSILSLYAAAPKTQATPPQPNNGQASLGSTQPAKTSAFGDLSDAFGGLGFNSTSTPPPKPVESVSSPPQPSLFSSFSGPSAQTKANPAPPQFTNPAQNSSRPPLSGGGFFDSGPKPPPKPTPAKQTAPPPLAVRKVSNASDGFGDFSSAFNTSAPNTSTVDKPSASSNSNGLLDLMSSPSDPPAQNSTKQKETSQSSSVFNLSAPKALPAINYNAFIQNSASTAKATAKPAGADPWGSNEWATNETPAATPATGASLASPGLNSATGADFGWGNSPLPTATVAKPLQSDWSKPSGVQSDWNKPTSVAAPPASQQSGWGSAVDTGGWGDPTPPATSSLGGFGATAAPPKITPEDDFGDWGSAPAPAPAPTTSSGNTNPAPKANSEDLWGNVWG